MCFNFPYLFPLFNRLNHHDYLKPPSLLKSLSKLFLVICNELINVIDGFFIGSVPRVCLAVEKEFNSI